MKLSIDIIARLSRAPEMRYTPSGTAVTTLSLVTSKKLSKANTPECPKGWKDGYGGKNWELTTFFRVTVWGSQAEACNQYLDRGSVVHVDAELSGEAVDGVLNPRIWTDNDGKPRASFEFTARRVLFVTTKANQSESGHDPQREDEGPPAGLVEENEIPF